MDSIQRKVIATRFVKFCIVGGSGALLQLGLTILFTNIFKDHITGVDTIVILEHPFEIEYYIVISLIIAIIIVTAWNFTWNLKWTFKQRRSDD